MQPLGLLGVNLDDIVMVRLRSDGVDAVITNRARIRSRPGGGVDVVATFGSDAAIWTVEVAGHDGAWSPPARFQVVAPQPMISAAMAVGADVEQESYTVNVFGTALTRDSRVLWNGQEVTTDPIFSSTNEGALTLGLRATVPAADFAGADQSLSVWTPGPGGGISEPYALSHTSIPLMSRWVFWASLFGVSAILAAAAHRVRMQRVLAGQLRGALERRDRQLNAERETTGHQASQIEAQTAEIQTQAVQLRRQAERLAALDASKNAFFVNVSHEFRTPLSLVVQPLETLLAGRAGPVPQPQRVELETARRGAERLKQLADQLLDLSRLLTGQLRVSPSDHDLAEIVRAVADDHAALRSTRGVTLAVDAPATSFAAFDFDALRKALSNLVSNALSFSPEGARVAIRLSSTEVEHRISVRDAGPGIAAKDHTAVFDRFTQLREPSGQSRGGLGVGLALAQELVEAHGGRIELESEPGFGSTFTIVLPRDPVGRRRADARGASGPAKARRVGSGPARPLSGDPSPPERTAAELGAPLREVKPKVLIAEDSEELRAVLRRALAPYYRVIEAADGAEALILTEANRPDLVLSDVVMPKLSGVQLVEALRRRESTADLPVILLSGRRDADMVRRGLEAGADGYINKPYDAGVLLARIERAIRRRRELQARYREELVEPSTGDVLTSRDGELFASLLSVLRSRLGEPNLIVDDVAFDVGLSASQLNRRLAAMGKPSAGQLLRRARLAEAARRLAADTGSVGSIARAVGFGSVKHFSRAFKSEYGVPPSRYVAPVADGEAAVG